MLNHSDALQMLVQDASQQNTGSRLPARFSCRVGRIQSPWLQSLKWRASEASKWILYPEQPLAVVVVMEWFWVSCLWSRVGDMPLLALTWFQEANTGVFEGNKKTLQRKSSSFKNGLGVKVLFQCNRRQVWNRHQIFSVCRMETFLVTGLLG